MTLSHKSNTIRDTVSLAGWLFADLLLGLSMLFLVFNTVGGKAILDITPTPTITLTSTTLPTSTPLSSSTPTITPSITPTPTKFLTATITPTIDIGINPVPVTYILSTSLPDIVAKSPSELRNLQGNINKIFSGSQGTNRKAALVITTGFAAPGNFGKGLEAAQIASEELFKKYPDIFSSTIHKEYWESASAVRPEGTIVYEIYFFIKKSN